MAAGGVVHIPWYATLFRGDKFELALMEIAPVAMRYGATEYAAYRYRDDQYKFVQMATFEDKLDFERYWLGDEFVAWRADYSSWYQVPVLYGFTDLLTRGSLEREEHRKGGSPRAAVG
jgi:hypothetical protein